MSQKAQDLLNRRLKALNRLAVQAARDKNRSAARFINSAIADLQKGSRS